MEKFSHEDLKQNKELSQESKLELATKETKQQLLELQSEVTLKNSKEKKELYTDDYEWIDVDGNIKPHLYYKEFIDFQHRTPEALSPSIMRIRSLEQLMPIITDKSETTYLLTIWANRCKPCMHTLPVLNEFSQTIDTTKTQVSYLDTESAPGMVEYLRGALHQPELATSYPTTIAVRHGVLTDAHVGGYTPQILEKMVTTS